MPRSIRQIELDIEAGEEAHRAQSAKLRRLKEELQAARLAEAQANPHPWLGQKVKRTTTGYGYRRSPKTQRGVVKVRGKDEYFQRGDTVRVGDLVVVSASGLTAYAFNDKTRDAEWELDQ